MSKMIVKYGLVEVKSDKMLTSYTVSNEGDFCNSVSVYLDTSSDTTWFADTHDQAEKVRNTPAAWYNADWGHPSHNYKPEQLKVVRVRMFIEDLSGE